MAEALENNTPEKSKSTSTKSGAWFRHDVGAHHDKKIQMLRIEGGWKAVGLYWALVEVAFANGGEISIKTSLEKKQLEMELGEKKIEKTIFLLVSLGLFVEIAEDIFSSERILHELSFKIEKSGKAKGAAERRWENRESNGFVDLTLETPCEGIATPNANAMPLPNHTIPYQTKPNQPVVVGGVGESPTVAPAEASAPPPEPEKKKGKKRTPKENTKPLVPGFTHIRMEASEVEALRIKYPDKEMRRFYYQAVDDYHEFNPGKRHQDCKRRIEAFIRKDRTSCQGWFSPKRGSYVNERPQRQGFNPNGTEKELLSIYARQGKPNGIP